MPLEIRAATDDDMDDLFVADGRAFGSWFTPEEIAERRPVMEPSRFFLALDGRRIAGAVGSFAVDLTLPGGACVPAAGVTWVSTQATHRRQGIMRQLLETLHRDSDERGEPVAILTASESAIYGRFGYGVASHLRMASLTKHHARLRSDAPGGGRVWFGEGDEIREHVVPRYDAYRRTSPGELSRSGTWWDMVMAMRSRSRGSSSPVYWLLHADGYAGFRFDERWNQGHPAHNLDIIEFVALTDAARGALWRTILDIDLVGEITTWSLNLDDPLPHWLEHPRAVRTTGYNDWLWVKPLDPKVLLGARTYGVPDRLVVGVGEARWSVDASSGEADVRKVRGRADLTTDEAGLGALLLGGVRPSELARAGRLAARDTAVLRRADALFAGDRLPYSQTPF